jgi:hypothetical protein
MQLTNTTVALEAAHSAVICSLAAAIILEIQPIYSLSPPDVHTSCSQLFYDSFTKGWETYTPLWHYSGYDFYCTSHSMFISHLSGWAAPSCTFPVTIDQSQTFHLTVSPEHPIYAIYSLLE